MCDACRWSDHDRCAGYLAAGRQLRCLCRDCLPQRPILTVDSGPAVLTLVLGSGSGQEPDLVPAGDRPQLRLVRGDA